jgi:hypothetical protein
VKLVTNLGVFAVNPAHREFELVSLHPGVTVEQVQEATGFPLRVSANLADTDAPTTEELAMIRYEVDPLGMRRLEFVAGKERGPLLAALIASEEAAIAEMLGRGKV